MEPILALHAVPGGEPAQILAAWSFQPLVLLPALAAAWLYLAGKREVDRRYPGARWPRARVAWFLSGLATILVALESPIDVYAEVFLWVHMIQHILLSMVAPPLLLLGMPITLALRALPRGGGRRWALGVLHSSVVRAVAYPLVAWLLFVGVLVGVHFSPLYEASLEHPLLHDVEHMLFLVSGLLFWWPVVGLDATPWRMPHPLRMLYLFLAGPVNTFVALAIYSANALLYPFYGRVARTYGMSPLDDQRWGGAVMWVTGDLMLLVSVVLVAAAWARHERLEEARLDARLDRERARSADGALPGP
jgi:cytochrome c oxidase assembly factor CtaG